MRLSNNEYKEAVKCLKYYNYIIKRIDSIREDIIGISAAENDGAPKAKYNISNPTLKQTLQLQENKELQSLLRKRNAVDLALELVNNDCKYIFEHYYRNKESKWDIIQEKNLSERTFERRKQSLIYTVNDEFKKIGEKMAEIH